MQKRHARWGAFTVAVVAVGLLVSALAGTAVAVKPPVAVNGSLTTYAANNEEVLPVPPPHLFCYHTTSTSAVDATLAPGGLVKGTLALDFYGEQSPCGPGSFTLTANGGSLTGTVANLTIPCPFGACQTNADLIVTNGTGRFHKFTGTLRVQIDWLFPPGAIFPHSFAVGSGTGTITGTLYS